MRQVVVVVLTSLGLVACGTSSGGGGGGFYYGADGSNLSDVTPTADTTAGEDGKATTDTKTGTDAATDVLQPGSLTTCVAASQCAIDACKANWTVTCGQTCANAAGKDAAGPASALLSCTVSKCLQGKCAGTTPPAQKCMDDCTASDCPAQLVACWQQGNSPGQKGCSSVISCLTGCDTAPERFTCQAACYNAMNTAGDTAFAALSACVNANGGQVTACSKESLVCLSDGKTGSGTCYDVQACIGKCASTDSACQGACYGSGSATAQGQLTALLSCVTTSGAAQCLTQSITCATPTGSTGCLDTATCVTGCPTGAAQGTCVMDCLHKASPGAASAFSALAPCMTKNCPNCGSNCQNCAISKCGSQAMACSGA